MLTRRQFEVLSRSAAGASVSQRALAAAAGTSLGTVNKTIHELIQAGLWENGGPTAAGLEALEPYRVRRAVFLAAGFGSRLVPITLNTPKPLVRVHGKRLIDTMLDAVLAAGIQEIYIVRGYLAEQFDQLLYDYPMVKFLENPLYNQSNNISSFLAAGELVRNAYVMEADLLVQEPSVIQPYQHQSNYLGYYTPRTDDWIFTAKRGIITGMAQGGVDGWHTCGVSYWTDADGALLAKYGRELWAQPGGRERYYDHIALDDYKTAFQVAIRPCSEDAIIEIDTFEELKALDKAYAVR